MLSDVVAPVQTDCESETTEGPHDSKPLYANPKESYKSVSDTKGHNILVKEIKLHVHTAVLMVVCLVCYKAVIIVGF